MTPQLYQVRGVRIASNAHARSHTSEPLLPPSFGNRKFRRRIASLARTRNVSPLSVIETMMIEWFGRVA